MPRPKKLTLPAAARDFTQPPPATWADHTTDAKEAFALEFPVHVGVDTGKKFHKLVARQLNGRRHPAFKVDVGREGFEAADAFLQQTFPGIPRERVLVGIEPAGNYSFTFAAFLQKRGYRVVTVLASVTKRFKETEDNSPRKDDDKDAAQVCKLLVQGFFVGCPIYDDFMAELRLLVTERHRLTREATGLRNRLIAALDVAWPECLRHFSNFEKVAAQAVLRRWPLAQDMAEASPKLVWTVIKRASRNHIPKAKVAALYRAAKTSVALTTATEARRDEIRRLFERWDLTRAQRKAIDARLAELVALHPGAKALADTVPEVSTVCAATLLAELGDPDSFVSPRQVLKLAGMNLAGSSSGVSVRGRVKQTKRGRPALRRELYLLAGRWCQGKRGLFAEEAKRMRATKKKKPLVICAFARKLVPMLLHILQTGEPFDRATWEARHGRPGSVTATSATPAAQAA
jgi:transposase